MPPVEVPATRSKQSASEICRSRSRQARIAAEKIPLKPPPSSASTRNGQIAQEGCSGVTSIRGDGRLKLDWDHADQGNKVYKENKWQDIV